MKTFNVPPPPYKPISHLLGTPGPGEQGQKCHWMFPCLMAMSDTHLSYQPPPIPSPLVLPWIVTRPDSPNLPRASSTDALKAVGKLLPSIFCFIWLLLHVTRLHFIVCKSCSVQSLVLKLTCKMARSSIKKCSSFCHCSQGSQSIKGRIPTKYTSKESHMHFIDPVVPRLLKARDLKFSLESATPAVGISKCSSLMFT